MDEQEPRRGRRRKEGSFQGMVLNFKKRRFFPNQDDTVAYQYTIFGYYDVMSIRPCRSWFEFSPTTPAAAMKEPYNSDYYDEYPIKLLFPPVREQRALEEDGFCFSSWRQIAGLDKSPDAFAPLLSVILVNVSSAFFSEAPSGGTALASMARQVRQVAGGTDALRKLCCAPFQSIGYYDFAVLLRTQDWGDALRLANSLRENSSISNCYLIPGIYNQCSASLEQLPPTSTTELSVRFNLRPGISPTSFQENLLKRLHKNYFAAIQSGGQEPPTRDLQWEEAGPQFSMNYGRSDCLMTCGLPLRFLLPLFLNLDGEIGLLNPGSPFFINHISSMRTSIRQPIDRRQVPGGDSSQEEAEDLVPAQTEEAETGGELQALKVEFQSVLGDFQTYLANNRLSIRQSRVLEGAMANFENLVRNPHAFDICAIVAPAFRTLLRNIERTIRQIDSLKGSAAHSTGMDWMNDMISAFRDLVGSFLLDLAASDRFFIEGLKLTHASIGSATKLLFAYNHIASLTVQALSEPGDQTKNYSFVVISGGCDITLTHSIDDHLQPEPQPDDPAVIREDRLLVVQLSEAGIFDIRGALFRLVHEIMHFCGDRLRRERAEAIVRQLSLSVAETLRCALFLPENLAQTCRIGHSGRAQLEEIIRRHDSQFVQEIAGYLEKELLRGLKLEGCKPIDLYSELFRERLYELCARLLQPSHTGGSAFVRRVYCAQLRAIAEIYSDCAGEKLAPGFLCTIPTVGAADARCYLQAAENHPGQPLTAILHNRVTLALVNTVLAGMLGLDGTFCPLPGWTNGQMAKLSAYLRNYRLDGMLDDIISLYSEGFADCMACTLLGLSASDYLLSFLYEIKDPARAMPDTALHTMRQGTVLGVCFGETGPSLSHKNAAALRKTFQHWKQCGWTTDRLTGGDIVRRTNQLLRDYQAEAHSGENQPLAEYLRQCIAVTNPSTTPGLQPIRDLFQAAYHLEDHNSVAKCVQALLQFWQQYAGKEVPHASAGH